MSRFNRLVTNASLFARKFRVNLSLDFGSSQTRVAMDKQLVWDQPTLLAWHQQLQAVVAVGEKAAALRGKTPEKIKIISPVQRGVIAELDFAEYYLKAIFDQLKDQGRIPHWIIAQGKVSLPAKASPIEKDQLQQVLEKVGIKTSLLLSKTQAVISLPPFKKLTQSHGIIDFGAQTVDLGIFTGQQLYEDITLESIAGDDFTQAVIDQVLIDHNLKIGWQVATQIKHQLLAGKLELDSSKSPVMTVRGKDAQTHLVKVVRVEAASFQEKFFSLAQTLLSELKTAINELPSEIITQLQEQGFYLTGGESKLLDWSSLIKENWEMPAITSSNPQLDVVKGLSNAR